MRLAAGATVLLALGLVLASTVPVWGQDVAQPPSAGDESPPRAGVLHEVAAAEVAGSVEPTVKLERKGRLLVLDYRPSGSVGGQPATAGPQGEPPRFAIYRGQRQIASGQFEYG